MAPMDKDSISAPKRLHPIDEATRQSYSPAAFRASHNIQREWGLHHDEAAKLLGMTLVEYDQALSDPIDLALTSDQFERAGLLIAMFGSISRLFGWFIPIHGWPKRPNAKSVFVGEGMLDLMMSEGVPGMKRMLGHFKTAESGF